MRALLVSAVLLLAVPAHPLMAQDLSCERGDRQVRAVRFAGAQEFPLPVLAATVATLPSTLAGLPFIGERRCLDPVEFARDVQRLEALYRRRGFPEVQVDTVVAPVRPGVIEVTFRIREGEPMRVTALRVRGTDAAPELRTAAGDFPLRVGGLFDRGALEAGRDTLVRRLRNLGWPQAEALLAYTTDRVARTAEVEVAVVPGARARIGTVGLDIDAPGGTRHVAEATIRRAMAVRPGDWYSARAIIDAQRNLYQTDIFQRVELQPDSLQPAGDTIVNLTARLVEGDRWAARGGLGWATLDCFRAQGTLTDRDFLPIAQRLELTARVSKIALGAPLDGAPGLCQGQARSDPYSRTLNYYSSMTLRQPVRASDARVPSLTLFSSTLSEYKAFLRRTPIGAVVAITDPFARRASARSPSTLSYQVELGRTEAEPAFFCAVFNACDADIRAFLQRTNRLAALELSLARERLNDPVRPTGGTVVRATMRHASRFVGSDRSQQFNRATADATWMRTVRGTTLTAHVRAGLVQGLGTATGVAGFIPPQERLYAGGPTTVRGFRQNELGPAVYIVSGYVPVTRSGETVFEVDQATVAERVVPTGGNSLVVANLEAQWATPVAPQLFQVAAFADAGRLWNRGAPGAPPLVITPGLGVRVASPFGAIRVDFGYNPSALAAGAAYFNAPLQAGVAPLYCVSPGNQLATRPGSGGSPPLQASGPCPATYRPLRRPGLLGRINPSIWIGQAF